MTAQVQNAIIAHALERPTEEVCGFIYCDADGTHVYPCQNVTVEGREDTFEIDPADYVAVCQLGIPCGIYHSHCPPFGPVFSSEDLDVARAMELPMHLYAVAEEAWLTYVPPGYEEALA